MGSSAGKGENAYLHRRIRQVPDESEIQRGGEKDEQDREQQEEVVSGTVSSYEGSGCQEREARSLLAHQRVLCAAPRRKALLV